MNIEENYDKIYHYCYNKVKNREIAEDITQETFLKFLEHENYHNSDKALQILYTIARNLCIDEFRKDRIDELKDEFSSEEDLEKSVTEKISLKDALKLLSDEGREMILMRYVDDVPVNVMAKFYGISRFALNRKLSRILGELREYLEKEEFS